MLAGGREVSGRSMNKVTFEASVFDSSSIAQAKHEQLYVLAPCSPHHAATSNGQHLIARLMPVLAWAASTTWAGWLILEKQIGHMFVTGCHAQYVLAQSWQQAHKSCGLAANSRNGSLAPRNLASDSPAV